MGRAALLVTMLTCLAAAIASPARAVVAGPARWAAPAASASGSGPARGRRPSGWAGRSRGGRSRVTRIGDPAAPTTVLVVGSIHGTETAGHAVIARLRRTLPPAGVRLLLVRTANPDGVARGTRQNARGVDLNRNFPFRWRGGGRPVRHLPPRPAARRASRRPARCSG